MASVLASGSSFRHPDALDALGHLSKRVVERRVEGELPLGQDVNGLSSNVADLLRAAPVLVQRSVLDQGSLATCRDPNAGCVGRIRKAERAERGERSAPVGFVAPSRDEVEAFIEENELNERAGEALRGAPPAVQWHVLEQGSLRSCREPSAGCVGRISKAKRTMDPALLAIPQGPSAFEVEEFIQENGLDERAASALQGSAQWLQRQVLDQGSLHGCRDRNAGLMGRLRRAQQAPSFADGVRSQASTATRQEIERFILDNDLNERAADALRSAGSSVQRQVLDQGSLFGTREPSAACIGRIAKIQKSGQEGWGTPSCPSLDDVERFIYENRLDQRAAVALEGAPPMVQQSLLAQGHLGGNATDASRACLAQIRATSQEFSNTPAAASAALDEVEQFIRENGLDASASNALRSALPAVQRQVLEQGSLTSCREPSAACVSRLRKAKVWADGNDAHIASPNDVERFIQEHDLNERAADALRGVPPEVQAEVLAQGSLATCRDPNAGCIGRIAKAQAAFKHRTELPPTGPSAEELTAFVREHNLSERCVATLHEVSAPVLRAVLDQGSLRGCRDPSAGCMGRIKKAVKDGSLRRGTKRQHEVAPAGGLNREVDRFVMDHELSDRAATVLREQVPEVQEMVLQGGSMRGTRDMSAVCMGRISKAVQELSQRPKRHARSPARVVHAIGGSRSKGVRYSH
ncbi:unnamed protein product [Cladocopium goreaui]|uniref:CUE domain-containing protein n=1 Tax=Cladocopium goreaui TaxID=2562237 RepID=A0A9P1BRA5_9DINO|nr:unnamed protein product [Cladocopium goreaui]